MIKISAKNFRSFRDVSYTIKPSGLVAVEGMYEGTKDRSNGAGKSTLIPELLCWAIYGETVDGKPNVCSTYPGADKVEVSVELPFVSWTRSQKVDGTGNKIALEGIRNYTDAKVALLKYFPPKRVFASTMILGQGVGEKFSSWTPAVRAKVLSELLNLTIWPEARKRLSVDRRGYTSQLTQHQGALSMLESQLAELNQAPHGDPKKREAAAQLVATLVGQLQGAQTEYSTASQELSSCSRGIGSYSAQVTNLEASIKTCRSEIAAMAKGLKCPTCQRPYPKTQVSEMQATTKTKLDAQQKELKVVAEQLAELQRVQADRQATAGSMSQAVTDLRTQHGTALQELNATQSHADQIANLQGKQGETQKQITDIEAYVARLDLLDRAFFEIPIRKIDGVLGLLNQTLVDVCNDIWESEFLVQLTSEHTTKAGAAKAEIGLLVENKAGDYKGSSPGQRRKIDITIQLAIRQLMMDSWPNALPLLVCDDVVDVLDPWAKRTFYQNYLTDIAKKAAVFVLTPQSDHPIAVEHRVLVGYTEEEGSYIASSSGEPILEFHGQA